MLKSRRIFSLGMLGALSLALAGCGGGGIKDALGYSKDAPDEFSVVTKAPLVIPPEFSLRPPQPGAPRPQEANMQPSARAQAALTGEEAAAASGATSSGEQALLAETGAAEADPNIRAVVNNETRTLVEKDAKLTDDILFWQQKTPPDERLVDAAAEKKRVEQNEAQGKPVTEGDTPSRAPEKPGFFSGLWSSIF
ncbi:DUF3035 domain-containing protein [Parvibaculum sedimenti]|uniref:DUF3035 domain-containing protein n=2 Tax=Parvibaculum sedimenti TaxID=2608632 RepID=A0A6N6VMV0_9HYPH|nr:DUF3035 domain-containing protein [Parvibaculum sedimenti]KAB7742881.1 DUF3035 domain-containing protein [Parvibaculum sedimenti]